MGTDCKIDLYWKKDDNTDFALVYEELPNRYIPAFDDHWYSDGQYAYPLFVIFRKLLEKKGAGHDYVRSYVRFLKEDFPFLYDELDKVPDEDFEGCHFTREECKAFLGEYENLVNNNTDIDCYFIWT